jgi:hypothetical protein
MVTVQYEITTLKHILQYQIRNQDQSRVLVLKGSFESNFPGRIEFRDASDSISCTILHPKLEFFKEKVCLLEWQLVQHKQKHFLEIISVRKIPPELEHIPTFYFDSNQVNFYRKTPPKELKLMGTHLGGMLVSKSALLAGSDEYYFVVTLECLVEDDMYQSIITIKGSKGTLRELTGIYACLLVNSKYYFNNMRPTKLKNVNQTTKVSSKVPVVMFECGKSEVVSWPKYVNNAMPRRNEFLTQRQLFEYSQSQSKEMISYRGEITRVIDPHLGVYELDQLHHLVLSFYGSLSISLRKHAIVALNNIHLLPKGDTAAYLVLCPYSSYVIERYSHVLDLDVFSDVKLKKMRMKEYADSNAYDFCFFESVNQKALELFEESSKINFNGFMEYWKKRHHHVPFVNDTQDCISLHSNCGIVQLLNSYPIITNIEKTRSLSATEVLEDILVVKVSVDTFGNLKLWDGQSEIMAVATDHKGWPFIEALCVLTKFIVVVDQLPPIPDTLETVSVHYVQFSYHDCFVLASINSESDAFEVFEQWEFQVKMKSQPTLQFSQSYESELVQYVHGTIVNAKEEPELIIELKGSIFGQSIRFSETHHYLLRIPKSSITKSQKVWILTWTDTCQVTLSASESVSSSLYQNVGPLMRSVNLDITNQTFQVSGILKAKYPIPSTNEYRIHETYLSRINGGYAFTNFRLIIVDHSDNHEMEIIYQSPTLVLGLVPNHTRLSFDRLALFFNDAGLLSGRVLPMTNVTIASFASTNIVAESRSGPMECTTLVYFHQLLRNDPPSRWVSCVGVELSKLCFFFQCPKCCKEIKNDYCGSCCLETVLGAKAHVKFEDGLTEFTAILPTIRLVKKLLELCDSDTKELQENLARCGYFIERTLDYSEEVPESYKRTWFEMLFYGNTITRRFHVNISHIVTTIPPNTFQDEHPTCVHTASFLRQRTYKDLTGQPMIGVCSKNIVCFVDQVEEADVLMELGTLLSQLSRSK